MSHRRSSLRRALMTSLAIVVGPIALLAPSGVANAVAVPTKGDVPGSATALAFDDGRLLTSSPSGGADALRVDTVDVPAAGSVTLGAGGAGYSPVFTSTPD